MAALDGWLAAGGRHAVAERGDEIWRAGRNQRTDRRTDEEKMVRRRGAEVDRYHHHQSSAAAAAANQIQDAETIIPYSTMLLAHSITVISSLLATSPSLFQQ